MSQLPCKQEGWVSLPMIFVWLLLSLRASQSELMYPHKNFKAHKGHKCHCTRRTGLYRKWLWHMGWVGTPDKEWVQQSKLMWLALLSAEHLQGAGRHLSTHPLYSPKENRGGQLTPGAPLGSHTPYRHERHGAPGLPPQLRVVFFFHVLETDNMLDITTLG